MKNKIITLLVISFVVLGLPTAAFAESNQIQAAAVKIDITPPPSSKYPPLNEYEHEKLYLRAIVLDNGNTRAALISADLGGISEAVWKQTSEKIATKLGTPIDYIILSSTHTHSDSVTSSALRFGTDFIADVALDAVTQAMSKLEPAIVGYSTGMSYLNVNRDAVTESGKWTQATNLDGPSDKTVSVLSFVKPNGRPIAAYVSYAMHPVSGYLAGFVSGDFPAAMSRHVEQAFDDTMITVFAQSASGDQNPRSLRTGTNAMASTAGLNITGFELVRESIEAPIRNKEVSIKKPAKKTLRQLADVMQSQGIILGEEVIRVMTNTDYSATSAKIWAQQTILTCPGRKRLDNVREGQAGVYENGEDVNIRLGVLTIGNVAIGTTAGEVYSNIGKRVKQESPMTNTMFVTIANGRSNAGYIPDDEAFGHQTFQILGSRLKPGCAEKGIAKEISQLVEKSLLH